jgi:hypothetical protein
MMPKVGDKIKWRLATDKKDRYNTVIDVELCGDDPYWFSTYWHIRLDNGECIRPNEVIEIVKPANM